VTPVAESAAPAVKRETRYLTADLDLVASCDLAPLADALALRGMFALHVSQREDRAWIATFETDEEFAAPDQNIAAMLAAIEGLDEASRSVWASCNVREFNIGYECGDGPRCFSQHIATATLAKVAAAGATVRITLYPAEQPAGPIAPDRDTTER
jgi:hypothetical protein